MKRAASALVLSLAVLCPVGQSAPAQDLQNSQVEVAYAEPSNADYGPIYERLKKRQVLEELQAFLAPLQLPKKVLVKIEQCNEPGRLYQPRRRSPSATSTLRDWRSLPPRFPAMARPNAVSRATMPW